MSYIARRILLSGIVIWGISVITFLIVRVVPSNPAAIYLGSRPKPDQIAKLTEEMGLNEPLITQYGIYVLKLLKGDLGMSLSTHRPVTSDILQFLPNTLELLFFSMILAVLIGIPLGAVSAKWKGKWFDQLTRTISIFGVSVPSFWIALVLQVIFFTKLGWLPISGQMSLETQMLYPVSPIIGFTLIDSLLQGNWVAFSDMVPHYILPVVTLALYPIGLLTRMTRSNLIEVLESDFIRLAKANGVNEVKILFHYALKNALGPVLTVLGLMFAYLITGAFFVEIIYNWPGVGSYAVNAILSMDYPAIMGMTLLIAIVYVITNAVTDLVQMTIDPRIKLGGEK